MTAAVLSIDATGARRWHANLHIDVTDVDLHITEAYPRLGHTEPLVFRLERISVPLRQGPSDLIAICSGPVIGPDGALSTPRGWRTYLWLEDAPPAIAMLIASATTELAAGATSRGVTP